MCQKSSIFARDFERLPLFSMKIVQKIVLFLLAIMPFAGSYAANPNRETVVLTCELHCQGCCDKIMKHIAWEKGVKDLVCDLKTQTVTVTYDKRKTDLETLLKAFERIGKPARPAEPAPSDPSAQPTDKP